MVPEGDCKARFGYPCSIRVSVVFQTRPWASTSARWKTPGRPRPTRKPRRGASLALRSSRTLSGWSPTGTSARPKGRRCCSRRPWRCYRRAALVSVGALPDLSHHERHRPAHARPSSRRGDHKPYPAVLSWLQAQSAVCRAGAAIAAKRFGRMECGAGQGGAWRVGRA